METTIDIDQIEHFARCCRRLGFRLTRHWALRDERLSNALSAEFGLLKPQADKMRKMLIDNSVDLTPEAGAPGWLSTHLNMTAGPAAPNTLSQTQADPQVMHAAMELVAASALNALLASKPADRRVACLALAANLCAAGFSKEAVATVEREAVRELPPPPPLRSRLRAAFARTLFGDPLSVRV